jgi:hypothetical protein
MKIYAKAPGWGGQAHLPRIRREKFKIEREGNTSNINAKNEISIAKYLIS